MGAVVAPYELNAYKHAVAAARTALGQEMFATSWAVGRKLEAEAAGDVVVADGVGLA